MLDTILVMMLAMSALCVTIVAADEIATSWVRRRHSRWAYESARATRRSLAQGT